MVVKDSHIAIGLHIRYSKSLAWFIVLAHQIKNAMTTPPTQTEISSDKLGPAGTQGELIIVAQVEGDLRSDNELLHDTTPRPFKVAARLGKTALVATTIEGDFGSEDGESYIVIPDAFQAERVRLNGSMMEFKKNSKGEKSLVEFECAAVSLKNAKEKFLTFALPFLDHQSYVSNCPIFIQAVRIKDENNHVQSIDYISPYRSTSVNQHLIGIEPELMPVFAMYREAKNSHSDFYKFLCYHKIMDGLLGTLRTKISTHANKLGINLTKLPDLVPDDPEIAPSYLSHIGTPIKKFFDNVITPQFRNALAHFIAKDGSILNLSDPTTMLKHAETTYILELCVRGLITSHRSRLTELAAHTKP